VPELRFAGQIGSGEQAATMATVIDRMMVILDCNERGNSQTRTTETLPATPRPSDYRCVARTRDRGAFHSHQITYVRPNRQFIRPSDDGLA
jgi:hypothetical protein